MIVSPPQKKKKWAATLNDQYKHFQTVNNPPSGGDEAQTYYRDDQDHPLNQEIDLPINVGRRNNRSRQSIKRNKSSGIDDVMNEHIISTPNFLPIYVKLFNIIVDHSVIPEIGLPVIFFPFTRIE